MGTRIKVDRSVLESNSQLPQRELAKLLGCSQDTVRRLLASNGVSTRSKLEDLVGRKFGKWEVLRRDEKRCNGTFWVCRCECGCEKSVNAGSLKDARTKSCKSCAYWEGVGELSKDHYNSIVKCAAVRGIEFNISMEYLWSLYLKQSGLCALSRSPIHFCRNRHTCPLPTASLDRIDSAMPYLDGNVQWVHKTIQFMKWKLSQEEFIIWCGRVSDNKNDKPPYR